MGNERNWLLVVDEAKKCKWGYFLGQRSDVVIIQLFRDMKNEKHHVTIVQCDNIGESTAIMEASNICDPGTQQHNGVVVLEYTSN
jgi:hypothetical protein